MNHLRSGISDRRWLLMVGPILMVMVLFVWITIRPPDLLDQAADKRESGLLVRFTQDDPQRTDVRVNRLAALQVSAGNPPTPFLVPGPFQAQWEGWIDIAEDDNYTFHFEGTGWLKMMVGDSLILHADEPDESKPVALDKGTYELRIDYRSPPNGPARMRLLWSGMEFVPEHIPPVILSHDGSDEALRMGELLRRGRELVADYGCLKCHEPEEPAFFEGDVMPELNRDAPALEDAGKRLRPDWIKRWLEDHHTVRNSLNVSHMKLEARDAADISAYISALGQDQGSGREESVILDTTLVSKGGRMYASLGCVACHSLDGSSEDERLNLTGIANKWYPTELAEYLQHPTRYYEWTTMPDFKLDDAEADAIAAFLISETRSADIPVSVAGEVQRGERLIQRIGCASCHSVGVKNLHEAPSLESLTQFNWQQEGSVSERNKDVHPILTEEDSEALQVLVENGFSSLQRRSTIEFAQRQIRELNCRACHKIDGKGDRWSDLEDEVAHLIPDDADVPFSYAQGRPALTWVGEKLQAGWLEGLLAGTLDYRARPWLEARMPAIGAEPVLLAKGMIEAHGMDGKDFEHIQPDPNLVSEGRTFARGLGRGFFCQSCHHGGAGGGFPAPDLSLLGERLKPDFFQWMLHSPKRVDQQTAMPAFADSRGRTRHLDRFDGDARKQFNAIWHYLVDSRAGRETNAENEERDAETPWAELYQQMDTGPFYSGVIDVPRYDPDDLKINPVLGYVTDVPTEGHIPKGLSIRVGEHKQGAIHFDHDLFVINTAWTGDFLEFRSPHDRGIRNIPPPAVAGDIWFTNPAVAGWSIGEDPQFTDPRDEPYGPISKEQGHYNGLYIHGDRVALSYTVAGAPVLESPWYVDNGQAGAFVRDVYVDNQDETLSALLFESRDVNIERRGSLQIARAIAGGRVQMAVVRANQGVELIQADKDYVALRITPQKDARTIRVLIWEGGASEQRAFLELASENSEPDDVQRLSKPGSGRWGEPLITRGELGEAGGPWAVDRITAPLVNPYNALLNFTGVDFLDDGRAVLTTMHGDVWLVTGLDKSLSRLEWQRFATGLNHPFGVRVVDGKIYVSTDDELLILHDYNEDGEADYYESFHNLIAPSPGAWRHAFGLEVDSKGNFYFARGRGVSGTEWENGVYRVSSDGSRMEKIATGFRQPWGMGISPEDLITVSQQEGTWVPQTPVNMIDLENRKGSFYGFDPDDYRQEDLYPRERGFEPPLVWIPRSIDNSGAGQVWIDSDLWGLPRGQMLHLAYGKATVLQIMYELVKGEWQGGVVPVVQLNDIQPRTGRFHPDDGQLYIAGLSSGGFERVRYTGEPLYTPIDIHAHENGLRIRFSGALNPQIANQVSNYNVFRWNYQWSDDYGSGYYSVENPELFGEDPVEVVSVNVLKDGREIFLEIPDMMPVDQMRIEYELESADGTSLKEKIHNTVHALRPHFEL